MNGAGWVYLVSDRARKMAKIGFTSKGPEHRLRTLQQGYSAPLDLLASFAGTQDDERTLLKQFVARRVRGEWFKFTDAMLEAFAVATPQEYTQESAHPDRTIPTTFSVPRRIVEEFRSLCKPAGKGETASQVIARLMEGWVARKRRNGAAHTEE